MDEFESRNGIDSALEAVGTGEGAARCHRTLQAAGLDPGIVDDVDTETMSTPRALIGPAAVRAEPPTAVPGLEVRRRRREDVSSLCLP